MGDRGYHDTRGFFGKRFNLFFEAIFERGVTAEVAKEQPQRTQRKANHQKRTSFSGALRVFDGVQGFADPGLFLAHGLTDRKGGLVQKAKLLHLK
jgi:hypothetical protein